MTDLNRLIDGLSEAQRCHVERGCISGDFSMSTIRALIRKGLFYHKIDSPDGLCGFVVPTELGFAVRNALLAKENP